MSPTTRRLKFFKISSVALSFANRCLSISILMKPQDFVAFRSTQKKDESQVICSPATKMYRLIIQWRFPDLACRWEGPVGVETFKHGANYFHKLVHRPTGRISPAMEDHWGRPGIQLGWHGPRVYPHPHPREAASVDSFAGSEMCSLNLLPKERHNFKYF